MRCSEYLRRAEFVTMIAASIMAYPVLTGGTPAMAEAPPATAAQQPDLAGLLAKFPNGGPQLSAQIRDIMVSNPSTATLDAILKLLTTASTDQASAVGVGLGQAAEIIVNRDPVLATTMQTEVVQSGNNPAMVAFSAIVGGDIKLAAAGPGSGSGGGGESPTGANSPTGGIGGSTPEDLHTFSTNTADSFPGVTFSSGTPGSRSVSTSTP